MSDHPARVMVWDEDAGEYIASRGGICLARWMSTTCGHDEGEICGDPAEQDLDGIEVCAHHRRRAVKSVIASRLISRRSQAEINAAVDAESRRRADAERLADEKRSIVYYLYRPGDSMIKIGTTANWHSRLGTHRRDHGELVLLLAHAGGRKKEREMHLKFASLRPDSSEWFRPGKPLVNWIRRQRSAADGRPSSLPEQLPLDEAKVLLADLAAGVARSVGIKPVVPPNWIAVVLAEPVVRPHPIVMPAEWKYCLPEEAAAYLGLSLSELEAWRAVGTGPACLQEGKLLRYQCESLPKWAVANVAQAAAAVAA